MTPASQQYKPIEVGTNSFKVAGKVTKIDIKYAESGNAYGTLSVELPPRNEKQKFPTRLYLKVLGKVAEQALEEIKENGNYFFLGHFKNNNYTDKVTGKKVYKDDFVVNYFGVAVEAAASAE